MVSRATMHRGDGTRGGKLACGAKRQSRAEIWTKSLSLTHTVDAGVFLHNIGFTRVEWAMTDVGSAPKMAERIDLLADASAAPIALLCLQGS